MAAMQEHSSEIALKCIFKLRENPEQWKNAIIAQNCPGKKSLDS